MRLCFGHSLSQRKRFVTNAEVPEVAAGLDDEGLTAKMVATLGREMVAR
jgi:hypothetical protein